MGVHEEEAREEQVEGGRSELDLSAVESVACGDFLTRIFRRARRELGEKSYIREPRSRCELKMSRKIKRDSQGDEVWFDSEKRERGRS